MSEVNRLEWEAFIRDSGLMASINRIEKRVGSMVENVGQKGKDLDAIFNNLAKAATAFFTINQAQQFVQQLIRLRSEFQQLEIAFNTMLGSKAKADKLTQDLIQFAATTPFGMKETANAAKQLLAYGSTAELVKDELRMLGDIAAGVSQPIGELVYLYGTLRTQGRAYAVDIRQFAGRGIPIYKELAKVLEINENQVNSFVESGKVGFAEVQKAMQNMTAQGSMFGGLMEAQSKTIQGELERLGDAYDLMLNKIGQNTQGTISSVIQGLSSLVENYDKVLSILTILVSTYGAYRAGIMATMVLETAQISLKKGWTVVTLLQYNALLLVEKAQKALNLTMMANPYVAIATVLAALVATMIVFRDTMSASEKAHKRFIDGNNQAAQSLENLKSKTSELVAVIRDSNTTQFQSNQAYSKLQALYPSVLGNISKETFLKRELTSVQKELNAEQDRIFVDNIGKRLEASKKQIEELIKQQKSYEEAMSYGRGGGEGLGKAYAAITEKLQEARIEADMLTREYNKQTRELEFANMSQEEKVTYLEKQRNEILKQIDFVKKNNSQFSDQTGMLGNVLQRSEQIGSSLSGWSLLNFQNQLNDIEVRLKGLNDSKDTAPVVRSENWINEQIKKLKELRQEQELNSTKWKEYNGQIEKLENELSNALGKNKKTQQRAVNETYKAQEKYLDLIKDIARTQDEFHRSRLSEDQQEVQSIKAKYKVLREEIEKFNRDPRNKKQGKFVDPTQIVPMEKEEIDFAIERQNNEKKLKLYQEDLEQYNRYNEMKKSSGESVADDLLGKYKDTFKMLTAEIAGLEGKKVLIGLTPGEGNYLTELKKIRKTQVQEQESTYQDLIASLISYEGKRKAILENYEINRVKLVSDGNQEAAEELDRVTQDELNTLDDANIQKLQSYKDLFDGVENLTDASAKRVIQAAKDILLKITDISPELKKRIEEAIKEAESSVNNRLPQKVSKVADEFSNIATSISTVNEGLGNMLGLLSNVLRATANIHTGFDALKKGLQDYKSGKAEGFGGILDKVSAIAGIAGPIGSIVSAVSSVVSGIVGIFKQSRESAIQARKEIDEYRQSVVDGEQDHARLLRERAREQENINGLTNEELNIRKEMLSLQGADVNNQFQKQLAELRRTGKQITGQKTERYGGFLGIGRKTRVVDITSGLQGLSYDEIEKLYNSNKLDEASRKAFERLQELKGEVDEIAKEWDNAQEILKDKMSGGISSDSFLTKLISDLKEGKRLFEDFGDDISGIIRDAMMSGMVYEHLEGPVQDLIDQFRKDSLDGLDPNEIKAFRDGYEAIIKTGVEMAKQVDEALGQIQPKKDKSGSLSKSIEGISENTANRLEAEFGGLRIAQLQLLEVTKSNHNDFLMVARDNIAYLNAIQINTLRTADNTERLANIESAIVQLNGKVINSDAIRRGAGL